MTSAFTLIEMSIVLVVIGLIVGGILVGTDLVRAAEVRAQVSQIEKYNQAVNTFKGKYGYLPGDINAAAAATFGFAARGTLPGTGDGNGLIQGVSNNLAADNFPVRGETLAFFGDLGTAGLIEGSYSLDTPTANFGTITGSSIDLYFPPAKINPGRGNHLMVYSNNSVNYLLLEAFIGILYATGIEIGGPGLTVKQAYMIDTKIDDGNPQTGKVTAQYLDPWGPEFQAWSCGGCGFQLTGNQGAYDPTTNGAVVAGDGVATAGSTATCYDNSATTSGTPGVAGATEHYSIEINSGNKMNCALSFQFQ